MEHIMNYPQRNTIFGDFLVSHKSPKTITAYSRNIERFFGGRPTWDQIYAVKSADINEYRNKMTADGYSTATINQHLAALSKFFKFLINEGLVNYNPFLNVPRFKQNLESNTIPLSESEARSILAEVDKNTESLLRSRDKLIIALGIYCGFRRSELASLKKNSFRVEEIRGVKYLIAKVLNTKSGRDHEVAVDNRVWLLFDDYLNSLMTAGIHIPDDQPMFISFAPHGGSRLHPLSDYSITLIVQKYARRAGIKKHVSAHTLRHTCGTLTAEGGADVKAIQEHLGHGSLNTTQRYIHRLEKFFNHPGTKINVL